MPRSLTVARHAGALQPARIASSYGAIGKVKRLVDSAAVLDVVTTRR